MSDLVKRLRSNVMPGVPGSLHEQAADRIEALEAALRRIAFDTYIDYRSVASAALAPEQDK